MNLEIVRRNGERFVILFDEEDLALVERHSWCITTGGYAATSIKRPEGGYRQVSLHRLLMGEPEELVDHANRDKLDNRRANLRLATPIENSRNRSRGTSRSGYKGVYPFRGKWRAMIRVDKKWRHVAVSQDPAEAARAYDRAALEHFGAFAALNFSDSVEPDLGEVV